MNGSTLGWLEVVPVAIAAVLVFLHLRDARRAESAAADQARPPDD